MCTSFPAYFSLTENPDALPVGVKPIIATWKKGTLRNEKTNIYDVKIKFLRKLTKICLLALRKRKKLFTEFTESE